MRLDTEDVHLVLPFPPSVNTYWRRCGNRYFISSVGKQFIENVRAICHDREPLRGRLAVEIELVMPDRRERDVDNYLKSTLDALAKAHVFESDNQIDSLLVRRGPYKPPGACRVIIREMPYMDTLLFKN